MKCGGEHVNSFFYEYDCVAVARNSLVYTVIFLCFESHLNIGYYYRKSEIANKFWPAVNALFCADLYSLNYHQKFLFIPVHH